ncbi:MAG: 6-carboxytetrahydropterin synthase [Chloroflexi bacterium]|nr:6-carboxytetrahydropterin synthase [Chloroflexota bacterium]
MYTLSLNRTFIAQHFLTDEDAGPENELHSHLYRVELMIEGEELDPHGYLVDIIDLNVQFDALLDHYRDKSLNDLPEFAGLNPSIEHFGRILCEQMDKALYAPNVTAISIKLYKDTVAWVMYDLDRLE